jgi:hypothetical protein
LRGWGAISRWRGEGRRRGWSFRFITSICLTLGLNRAKKAPATPSATPISPTRPLRSASGPRPPFRRTWIYDRPDPFSQSRARLPHRTRSRSSGKEGRLRMAEREVEFVKAMMVGTFPFIPIGLLISLTFYIGELHAQTPILEPLARLSTHHAPTNQSRVCQ